MPATSVVMPIQSPRGSIAAFGCVDSTAPVHGSSAHHSPAAYAPQLRPCGRSLIGGGSSARSEGGGGRGGGGGGTGGGGGAGRVGSPHRGPGRGRQRRFEGLRNAPRRDQSAGQPSFPRRRPLEVPDDARRGAALDLQLQVRHP